jgi:hypothetical protein
MNPDPLTVSVKAEPPAFVNNGDMPLMTGTGFACITVTAVDAPVALL